jgi:hypothetical protein
MTRMSAVVNFQFTLDVDVPTPPTLGLTVASDSGQSNTDNNTNVVRPTIRGIAEPSALVRVFTRQLPAGPLTLQGELIANSTGNFQIQVGVPLAEGSYEVTATQTDLAGNVSPAQVLNPNLIIDTTAPAAPVFDLSAGPPPSDTGSSQSDHITNQNRPNFAGNTPAEEGSTVRIFAQRLINGQPSGTIFQIAQTVIPAGGAWTAVFSGNTLADGTYRITGQITDIAGNLGATGQMAGFDLVIDTVRPASPGLPSLVAADDSGVSNSDRITNVRRPRFTGTSEANANIQILVRSLPSGTNFVAGQGQAVGTTYTIQLTNDLPADGSYEVSAVQVDAAGNVSLPSSPLSPVVLDTQVVAPVVDLSAASDSGLSNSDNVTNITTPTFTGTGEVGAAVTVTITGPGTPAGGLQLNATVGAAGTYSVTVPGANALANGTFQVVATQTDRAGNVSPDSPLLTPPLVIDTQAPSNNQAPSVPRLNPLDDSGRSNSDGITNVRMPRFTGTGEIGATVRLFVQLGAGAPIQMGTAVVDGSGNYAIQVNSPLADGTYQVTADQMDVAGNVSPRSATTSPPLVVDGTAPGVPTLRLDPLSDTGAPNDNRTASIPQVFTGTANASPDSGDVVIRDGGAQVDSFSQPAATTAFTRTLNLANGNHSLTVTVTDAAGNSNTSAPLTVVVDPNELDGDRKYVRALYQQELGRLGSLAEWNLWAGLLATPDGRRSVANGIARSREARTRLVESWYQLYLGRSLDAGAPWVDSLVNGAREEDVLAQILGSQEFFNRAPTLPGVGGGPATNSTFVRALYVLPTLLNRQPSTSEVNFWVGQIPTLGRAGVALQILASAEYRTNIVRGYYINLLGRPANPGPSQAEINGWVFSGLDITSIRVGFLSSLEYFNRVSTQNI